MHARFKLVKAKADISNENKNVKRFKSTWGRNDLYSTGVPEENPRLSAERRLTLFT